MKRCFGSNTVKQWLITNKGVEPNIADAVLKAFGSQATVSQIQLIGERGFNDLLEAISREQPKSDTLKSVAITFQSIKDGRTFLINAAEGDNIMDLCKNHSTLAECLECTCGGIAACSTCHVFIEPAFALKFPPPEEAELDMLDLACDAQENSRLGCQIKFTKECNGIRIGIPKMSNNLF